ncbi:MAG: hypothetical protein JXM75_00755, partial [Chromatiaceae bacterium]|nr:hypothetical protein [Chromatiaceae bacterium]
MLKRLTPIALTLALSVALAPAWAEDDRAMRFKVTDLVELPHPIPVIRKDPERFNITPEQRERLEAELIKVFPPEIHPRMQRAWELQNRVRRGVMKQSKDSAALAAELDELSTLKREIATLQIDALQRLRTILSEEQFSAVMAAM